MEEYTNRKSVPEFPERDFINRSIQGNPPVEIGAFSRSRLSVFVSPSQSDVMRDNLVSMELAKHIKLTGYTTVPSDIVKPIIAALGKPFHSYEIESSREPKVNEEFKQAQFKVHSANKAAVHFYPDVQLNAQNAWDNIVNDIVSNDESKIDVVSDPSHTGDYEYKVNTGDNSHRIRVAATKVTSHLRVAIYEDADFPSNFSSFDLDPYTSLGEAIYPPIKDKSTCACESTIQCNPLERIRPRSKCRRGHARMKLDASIAKHMRPPQGLLSANDFWVEPIEQILNNYARALKKAGVYRFLNDCTGEEVSKEEASKTIAHAIKYHAALSCGSEVGKEKLAGFKALSKANMILIAEQCIEALSGVMRDWVQLKDVASPRSMPREDFIGCYVNGRAIMFADLRPDTNPAGSRFWTDKQTRCVILDLGMNKEQRGRLVHSLMNCATYRNLALRDFPYIQSVTQAINELKVAADSVEPAAVSYEQKKTWFFRKQNTLKPYTADSLRISHDQLSVIRGALEKLDVFFTDGICGTWTATQSYTNTLKHNLIKINQVSIDGFQTISEYLSRYEYTIQKLSRLHDRYQQLITTIDGKQRDIDIALRIIDAVNIETGIRRSGGSAKRLGIITIVIGVLSLFLGLGYSSEQKRDEFMRTFHDYLCEKGIHMVYPTNAEYHINDNVNEAGNGILS